MTKANYGVFKVGGAWKFYREQGRASDFKSRAEAMSAAHSAMREAVASGAQVELYVEDATGRLTRTTPASIAH